jgi:hypothetical protein
VLEDVEQLVVAALFGLVVGLGDGPPLLAVAVGGGVLFVAGGFLQRGGVFLLALLLVVQPHLGQVLVEGDQALAVEQALAAGQKASLIEARLLDSGQLGLDQPQLLEIILRGEPVSPLLQPPQPIDILLRLVDVQPQPGLHLPDRLAQLLHQLSLLLTGPDLQLLEVAGDILEDPLMPLGEDAAEGVHPLDVQNQLLHPLPGLQGGELGLVPQLVAGAGAEQLVVAVP